MKKTTVLAILFDHDDTLVRTSEAKYAAFKDLGLKYSITLTDANLNTAWGLPLDAFMKALYNDIDTVENLKKEYDAIRDRYPSKPEKDAIKTISLLSNKIKVGVVSAASKDWVKSDLTSLGFPIEKFSFIQGSEDTLVHKPDPEVFTPILEYLSLEDISKDRIVYVGDSLRDYNAAKNAQLDFYGLADRTTTKEAFIKAGAKYIHNFSELLTLIK